MANKGAGKGAAAATPDARRLYAVAALVGMATMMLELTATRALAPWFGASILTWTNVIGVVLLALAVGAWLGGLATERGHSDSALRNLLLLAGVLVVPAAFLIGPLSSWVLPAPAALNPAVAPGHIVRGSLVVTALVFGPAVLLLGMVGPWVVHLVARASARPGAATGRTFACSTLGSLVGTYLPAHVLIEGVGVRWTFLLAGALLLVAAGVLSRRPARPLLLALLALGLSSSALVAMPRTLRPAQGRVSTDLMEREIEAEFETPYQHVRVSHWESNDGSGRVQREKRLILDEGLLEFHSVLVDGSLVTGHYYDVLAVVPALQSRETPLDIAILGGGAGTLARSLRGLYGDGIGRISSVEIDPEVSALRGAFGVLSHPRDEWVDADARVFLAGTSGRFGLVVLDAYSHQIEIPAHLATHEFFTLVREHLQADGLFALNVSAADLESPLVGAILATLRPLFARVSVSSWPGSWNVLVLAQCAPQRLLLDGPIPPELAGAQAKLRRGWVPLEDLFVHDRILTDDLAPLTRLARAIR